MEDIVAILRNHRFVGFDTSVFIYHLEKSQRYADVAATALSGLASNEFGGVTSVLTLMEIAVRPLQISRSEVADIYGVSLNAFPNLAIVAIDSSTARLSAELRATYRLSPPDAIQVAACMQHGATAFVTSDKALRRITNIEILLIDDFVDDPFTSIY